jgi:uridine kinase
MEPSTPAMIIGICGGTGSGKTTVAQKIISAIGESKVAFLQQDSYYRDLKAMPLDERHKTNFDHPDSFDGDLLLLHLEALRTGNSIERPMYDFATHSRKQATLRIEPLPVILFEGILIFSDERMRRLMDLRIFMDCDADIRFTRRLERDTRERGRSAKSVIEQYLTTVRPMHEQCVAPCMRYADIIIPHGGYNDTAIDLVVGKIQSVLAASI